MLYSVPSYRIGINQERIQLMVEEERKGKQWYKKRWLVCLFKSKKLVFVIKTKTKN
jgi:hypothetical protein